MAKVDIKGIMPPVTTPFNSDGSVDTGALAANVGLYKVAGFTGYVALGSNGEAAHLDREERFEVVKTVKQAAAAANGSILIAGVNEQSTRAAISAVKQAADAGADVALVITPYFYKSQMTSDALYGHFSEVADKSPLPIMIYNIPQNTGVVVEPTTVGRLSRHDNIVGIKDSSGNVAAGCAMVRLTGPSFTVTVGSGAIVYPALVMGVKGAILGVACVAANACVELYKAAMAGDHQKARDIQHRLAPVSNAVTSEFGVAGLKAALDIVGLNGGLARGPLVELSESQKRKIETIIRESGLIPGLG